MPIFVGTIYRDLNITFKDIKVTSVITVTTILSGEVGIVKKPNLYL